MTFSGVTGDTVTCVVEGQALVGVDAIEGEMTERLSSERDLNCASSGRFVFTFDE
jgi:hypothetical protein